tara:strand:- start:573 stop:839 length:267 start_codon:yes stop_codon:yes gene_type:complete
MSNYIPEHGLKLRRIAAVKKALNTPHLPEDMSLFWQSVLKHLNRSKIMSTKPEIILQQLSNSMEEIIVLLEEIIRTLKSESLRKREKD